MTALTPRLLTDKQAADYCNLPLATFLKQGWGRVRLGSRVRFDRYAIDRHLNELQGMETEPPPGPPVADVDDPEAALARFRSSRADASARRS